MGKILVKSWFWESSNINCKMFWWLSTSPGFTRSKRQWWEIKLVEIMEHFEQWHFKDKTKNVGPVKANIYVFKKTRLSTTLPSKNFLDQNQHWNTITIFKICSNVTLKTLERGHLVSLSLTMNWFHKLFWYFYCWLWTIKCRVGYLRPFSVKLLTWEKKKSQTLKRTNSQSLR